MASQATWRKWALTPASRYLHRYNRLQQRSFHSVIGKAGPVRTQGHARIGTIHAIRAPEWKKQAELARWPDLMRWWERKGEAYNY